MAEGALVEIARPAAADIEQHQAQGPPDRRIGPVARAERVAVAVHAHRTRDRPVDDQQRGGHVGRRLHPVQVERLRGQRQRRRAHHRRIFWLAAGHHHVDRHDFAAQTAVARRHLAFDQIRVAAQCRDEFVDPLPRRRHHWQPVGPALREIPFDEVGAGRHTEGARLRSARRHCRCLRHVAHLLRRSRSPELGEMHPTRGRRRISAALQPFERQADRAEALLEIIGQQRGAEEEIIPLGLALDLAPAAPRRPSRQRRNRRARSTSAPAALRARRH